MILQLNPNILHLESKYLQITILNSIKKRRE